LVTQRFAAPTTGASTTCIEYFTIVSGTEAGFRTLANCRIEQTAQKVRIQIKSNRGIETTLLDQNAAMSKTVLIESEPKLWIFVLPLFLHANRYPFA
jgi:hypothetical protein